MGSAVGEIFGFSAPKAPKLPKLPKAPTPPSTEEQAQAGEVAGVAERERLRKLKGISSTLLTSPLGLTNEATTQRKTLLGA